MKRCTALFNDGWADWEAGPVLAVLREHLGWSVKIATPTGQDAESIGGVRARADLSFAEVDPAANDLILVIGSAQWTRREHPEVYDLMRRTVGAGVPLGAICGATVAAARSGILDDRAHTGNSLEEMTGKAASYRGSAHYRHVPTAVSDQGVVTAAGESPMTFAAEVIRLTEKREGDALAAEYLAICRTEHR